MTQNHSDRMRRLLASDLLPQRAGQPVKALVHVSFADLCELDADSALQDTWIAEYRARWAAYRAAASVVTGDGGAWLDGGKILQVLSGPAGVASFLRRNLLGKGLNGPSLPLDVGQTDDIPVHLRRLVALRDQTCQHPGGCDQPAAACEPHHVQHLADGGRTSLANLKDYCWWHHHVVLHQLGWTLTAHPDGTSQVTSPAGQTIRSHGPPPPRPG